MLNVCPLNMRQSLKKSLLLFSSEICIFDIFFKKLDKVGFQDLQTRDTISHKMVAL